MGVLLSVHILAAILCRRDPELEHDWSHFPTLPGCFCFVTPLPALFAFTGGREMLPHRPSEGAQALFHPSLQTGCPGPLGSSPGELWPWGGGCARMLGSSCSPRPFESGRAERTCTLPGLVPASSPLQVLGPWGFFFLPFWRFTAVLWLPALLLLLCPMIHHFPPPRPSPPGSLLLG